MHITPFATEQYYAQYEFSAPHMLSASDCQTVSVGELLELAGLPAHVFRDLMLGYTEAQGHPELRAAVAATHADVRPDDVIILGAPEEGIFLAMHALLSPGDEAIVLAPAYDSLRNLAAHVCGTAHAWQLATTDDGWELDFAALRAAINARTKLLVVNFPHNPTGFLPTREQFEAIVDIASRNDIWLLCDEMYRGLEYGARPQLPSAADLYARSVVLAGLSKTYGLPGLRTGWLVVRDPQTRDALVNWKHYTTICPPAPSELLAQAALSAREQLITRNAARIRANLQLVEPFFDRWSDHFTWRPPLAGSVALAGIRVPSATDYCHRLAQAAGVVLLPGGHMGIADTYVRFGFGRETCGGALAHYDQWLERHGLTA